MNEQQIFNFTEENFFLEDDFCISKSNEEVYHFLNTWPNWSENIVNIYGPEKSGKTFLLSIFAQKNSFIKISNKEINKSNIDYILKQKKIIIEDISDEIDNELLFLIYNHFKSNENFLIFSSLIDTANLSFSLNDLNSRFKSVFNIEIHNPSDNLLYSILLKGISDRQITLEPKIIDFILGKIERTYLAVNTFVKLMDKKNLVDKKKITKKLVNSILERN